MPRIGSDHSFVSPSPISHFHVMAGGGTCAVHSRCETFIPRTLCAGPGHASGEERVPAQSLCSLSWVSDTSPERIAIRVAGCIVYRNLPPPVTICVYRREPVGGESRRITSARNRRAVRPAPAMLLRVGVSADRRARTRQHTTRCVVEYCGSRAYRSNQGRCALCVLVSLLCIRITYSYHLPRYHTFMRYHTNTPCSRFP